MKSIRALSRLLFFALYTIVRTAEVVIASKIWGIDWDRSLRVRRSFVRFLLPRIGVRLHIEGIAPDYPCLIVGNHRSYLDPAFICHEAKAFAVSKAEVAHWPIIGYGTRVTGTLYLQRESAGSRKYTLDAIEAKLREGWPVVLFPEGTTTSLPKTGPFKMGSFRLAAQTGYPIVPAAIRYADPADYWLGDDTFVGHFMRMFGKKRIEASVSFGPPMRDDNPERLMLSVKNWIDARI
ncbi:MAG: lysophospholipid acyltransferase family protein [Saprospiraceae bacterium]